MALEEIAVADIKDGQTILVLYSTEKSVQAKTYVVQSDGASFGADAESFYLLKDIPTTPPFEVPWGTVQRDKEGDLWEFAQIAGDEEGDEGVVAAVEGVQMFAGDVAEYAPFTRLYTVQELIDLYREYARVGFAEVLARDLQDGII